MPGRSPARSNECAGYPSHLNLVTFTPELLLLVIAAAVAWFWLSTIRVREVAVAAARHACDAEGLMLLDDTVSMAAMKPVRDDDGQLKLQRRYEFEYSDTGDNRREGSLVLVGRRVVLLNVGLRDALAPVVGRIGRHDDSSAHP